MNGAGRPEVSAAGPQQPATVPAMGEEFETETCIGCGLTVEVDSPVFLEWDADVAGWSTCPECRAPLDVGGQTEEPEAPPATPRRAA